MRISWEEEKELRITRAGSEMVNRELSPPSWNNSEKATLTSNSYLQLEQHAVKIASVNRRIPLLVDVINRRAVTFHISCKGWAFLTLTYNYVVKTEIGSQYRSVLQLHKIIKSQWKLNSKVKTPFQKLICLCLLAH